jgi:hypothetical protein
MALTRIIRASRDLHFAPCLPPHPDPLEWVAHGSLCRGFVDGSLAVDPSIAAALDTALRFAHQLILHPGGLQHAAMLLGHNNAPDALIVKAIRRVLSTRRWTICLDEGIGAGNALHRSPTRLALRVRASETTLFHGLEVRISFGCSWLKEAVGSEAGQGIRDWSALGPRARAPSRSGQSLWCFGTRASPPGMSLL